MLRVLPLLVGLAALLLVTGHWEILFKVTREAGQWLWPYLASFLDSIGAYAP